MTPYRRDRLRQDLPTWRRIRRYAVPTRMIAEATTARLAGDWAGACRAARVVATVDLDQVRREYGREAAEDIGDDLAHFAPDLLRWHLPRALGGRTSLGTQTSVVLAPRRDTTGPLLRVRLPRAVDGPQRLRLDVISRADLPDLVWFDMPRHLWDARRADELRAAWGGSDRRPPLLNPDATPIDEGAVPEGRGDAAAANERTLLLLEQGDVVGAWHAAGIELDSTIPETRYPESKLENLGIYPLWPVGVAREARRLAEAYGAREVLFAESWRTQALLTVSGDGPITARISTIKKLVGLVSIGEPIRHRPADLDLLWYGLMEPDDLHPLVRCALFPELPAPHGRPADEPVVPPAVPVRCQGVWHQVQIVDGRIRALSHSAEEEQREELLRALGGTSTGCFATQRAWTEGTGRLPKRLNDQRRDLLLRILHGETEQIVAMFDAGQLDPHTRDGRRWTLMHLLTHLDHEVLLPRLLAAGVSLEARDVTGRTPLHLAVTNGASTELVRALWRVGADPHASSPYGATVLDLLARDDVPDFDFLTLPPPTTSDTP